MNALIEDPVFSSWQVIVRRVMTFYDKAIEAIGGEPFDVVQNLITDSDHSAYLVLTDPATRVAVNGHVASSGPPNGLISTSPVALVGVMREALSASNSGISIGPGRIEIYSPTQWAKEWPSRHTLLESAISEEIIDSVSSKRVTAIDPSSDDCSTIRAAVSLLTERLGDFAQTVLRHIRVVVIIDQANPSDRTAVGRSDMCQNVSTHAIPGTVFITPSVLTDQMRCAEALFHEGCHKKLSDAVLTQHIFVPAYDTNAASQIEAVWNDCLAWNSNMWPTDRALYALHYYTYAQRAYAMLGKIEEAKSATLKARYLLNELDRQCKLDLGNDGQHMLETIDTVLPTVEIADVGIMALLMIDRYERQTENLSARGSSLGEKILDHLLHSDLVSTYRILSVLGQSVPPTHDFYETDRWICRIRSDMPIGQKVELICLLRRHLISIARGCSKADLALVSSRGKTAAELLVEAFRHASNHIDL